MAHSVEIPQDIIDNVIAALGNDKRSLRQCALVSSSFLLLLPSRKKLFYSIDITFGLNDGQRLHQILAENPVIQSFVRELGAHQGWASKLTFDKWLLDILTLPFCHLEKFSLTYLHLANWSDLGGELKDALSTLIHSPTLKILYLRNVKNAPITLFLGIVNFTELHLSDVSLNYSDGEQLASPLTLNGVGTTTSQPVIDKCPRGIDLISAPDV